MKKKVLISILILVLLLVSGCGEKVQDNFARPKVEKEELVEQEISFLMDRIENLKYIDFYGKSFKSSELTNQEILQVLNNTYDELDNVSFKELESKALSYFNYYLNPEDILCDTHTYLYSNSDYLYKYDALDKVFKFNTSHTGHKVVGVETKVINKYVDSYKEDDTYTIVVYKVFSELVNSDNSNYSNYYRSYNDAILKSNLLFVSNNPENEIDNYTDELVKYTYTFVKNEDNYYLSKYMIG